MAEATGPSWKFIAPPLVIFRRDRPRPKAPCALPARRLRLGEFLFHTGVITWKDCCEAVRWQRGQRPLIGEIAIQFRFLTIEQVAEIFRRRASERAAGVGFGEFAVRIGYLTHGQVVALVGQQRRLQRRLGERFVERGLLDAAELDEAVRAMRSHNGRVLLGVEIA